ncbi:hypothetical protein ACHAXR_011769 [Thalassiosira sp. AJA248-18]
MVGFGSSLRMSRRRGWEDAYLDYQSLRLLLTQIEAVYEEEDWKRGGGGGSGSGADLQGMMGEEGRDQLDGGVVAAAASDDTDDVNDGWRKLWGNAWRVTQAIVKGKRSRRRRRRYPRVTRGNNVHNHHGEWVQQGEGGNGYFDYSPEQHRRKRKKEKGSHDRALDRGGWRSPGATDYRDELFLVSDEEFAYGYDDDGNTDDEEWEDEEDSIGEEEDQQYYDNEVVHYDIGRSEYAGLDSQEGSLPVNEVGSNLTKLTPGSEKSEMEDVMMGDQEQFRDCNSPSGHEKNKDDVLFGPKNGILQTPDSHHSPNNDKPGNIVQFSDSPGVLEAGYETFAAAAARRGFVSPAGDSQMMTVGSPSEKGGWLDFIPNLLSKGKQQQQNAQSSSEIDPLLLNRRESSEQDLSLNNSLVYSPLSSAHTSSLGHNVIADDSPNRYTHFSETFHSNRTSSDGVVPDPPMHCPPPYPPNIAEEDPPSQHASALAPIYEYVGPKPPAPMTLIETPPLTKSKSAKQSVPVQATALGNLLPMTPMTPPMTPKSPTRIEHDNRIGGFGVSLKMIPTESSELLHPSSPRKTPNQSDFGMSQFYSFKNEDDYRSASTNRMKGYSTHSSNLSGEYDRGDEEEERRGSNMISFYGGKDGYFSLRSPTKFVSRRHHHPRPQHSEKLQNHRRLPSLSSVKKSMGDSGGGNFIMSFFLGNPQQHDSAGENTAMSNQGPSCNRGVVRSSSNEHVRNRHRSVARQKRAASFAKRKRARLRKQRQLQSRRECVPEHLRISHVRAAAITERFRGLLRAEVEKVILFANSRLGELSDTIGSLRYSSYEDGQEEMRKRYPSLADGGMHQLSSSEDDSGMSCASSVQNDDLGGNGDHHIFKSDSSKDETKNQIMLRDRLRISRPMFQKADFLGEDFSLLSALDEADAYTAVGVELMHLLKYICVNIIAARKICKKHDRLLSNRMLGGYYQRLAAEAKKNSADKRSGGAFFHLNEAQPQFGGTLSNLSTGYILGIYDTKIQHIANSATMQTVSSSLAIALSDFEASQSRSTLLGLGFGSKTESKGSEHQFPQHEVQREVPSPRHQTFTTSRLRDAVSRGQCFRGDDESTVASQEGFGDENASTSSNTSLTRLQFVVTSIFGLREAARFKTVPFENHSSRLFMISTGANVFGEGLDGCSRETLDFLTNYNPDSAYTLDMETLFISLKNVGRGKDGIGGVMVASLAAASKDYDLTSNRPRFRRLVASAMSINPQAAGEENDVPAFQSMEYQNILRLNTISTILYLTNYYIIVPTAHIHSISLGSRSSTAVLIGSANISSIISSFIHTLLISKPNSFVRARTEVANFRVPLLFCSCCAVAGNILYSCSLSKASFGMALVGRILVGFGSAEVLNRQLLSSVLPQESVNTEAASLAKMSMITIAVAFIFGSLVDKAEDRTGFAFKPGNVLPVLADSMQSTNRPSPTPTREISLVTIPAAQPFPPLPLDPRAPSIMPFTRHNIFSLESIGYAMAFAWLIHLIGIIFFFDLPKSKRKTEDREPVYNDTMVSHTMQEEDFDSDTETHQENNPSTETNPFMTSTAAQRHHSDSGSNSETTFEKLQTMKRAPKRGTPQHTYLESITNVRRLMFSNVAFPTTIAILFIVKTTAEVLLSSCGTISSRYFNWSGARSGLFMSVMSSMILPVNLSLASQQNFTERSIMKVALERARYGFLLMVNYESVLFFFRAAVNGGLKEASPTKYYYDGVFGAPQYMLSFATVFFSLVMLESATLTLLSKVQVAPRQMKKYSIDSGFMVIIVSALGRLVGDILIFAFDFSSSTFFNDMVNSLCFSLIIALTAGIYIVRKHFFFLI